MRNFLQLKSRTRATPEPIWAREPVVKVCCWVSPSQSLDTTKEEEDTEAAVAEAKARTCPRSQATPNTFSFCVQVPYRNVGTDLFPTVFGKTTGGKWWFLPCCRLHRLFKFCMFCHACKLQVQASGLLWTLLCYVIHTSGVVLRGAAQMLTSTSMFHCQRPLFDKDLKVLVLPEGTWPTGDRGDGWWWLMWLVTGCVYQCIS